MKYLLSLLLLLPLNLISAEDAPINNPPAEIQGILDHYFAKKADLLRTYNRAQIQNEHDTVMKLDAIIHEQELHGHGDIADQIAVIRDGILMEHTSMLYPEIVKGNWRMSGPDAFDGVLTFNPDHSVQIATTVNRFGTWEITKDGIKVVIKGDAGEEVMNFTLTSPNHLVSEKYSLIKIRERQW